MSAIHVDVGTSDRGRSFTNQIFAIPAARITPSAHFKPRKDQRQAVNRWNRHVLGEHYQAEAAKLQPRSKADKARARNDFDLTSAVHESEFTHLKEPHPEPAHKFEVTLESDSFTEEKFKLFENYQKHVHHDPPERISRGGFRRFLCESPLHAPRTKAGSTKKLGSFHQCYRLDGRLIAMAVLDLLPHCVSGVYFIYHSDFEKFSFGKISALREAALAHEGGYEYYYMGYYIHSCDKMRYKNDYQPQHFLDLETMKWHELDDSAQKLMSEHHYLSMSLLKDRKGSDEASAAQAAEKSASEVVKAYDEGTSLFDLDFAGMMTAEEIEASIDLDEMIVQIKKNQVVQAKHFVKWDDWSIHDCGAKFSIKGAIAQLVACVGPEVAQEIIVSFCG